MATITDLYGNAITELDLSSVGLSDDANINVFEFGSLILADLFPTLLWVVNQIADLGGSQISATDSYGTSVSEEDKTISNGETYSFDDFSYSDDSLYYGGIRLEGETEDAYGSQISIGDLAGSLLTPSDYTTYSIGDDTNLNVFEFGSLILADVWPTILWLVNEVFDIGGTALTVGDSSGDDVTVGDISFGSFSSYDYSGFTYDFVSAIYDQTSQMGGVIDISGS